MNLPVTTRVVVYSVWCLVFALLLLLSGSRCAAHKSAWKPVEDAMGRPGTMMGDVLRFGMPRKDLHVLVRGTAIKPGLALGSGAAFKNMGDLDGAPGDDDGRCPALRDAPKRSARAGAGYGNQAGTSAGIVGGLQKHG